MTPRQNGHKTHRSDERPVNRTMARSTTVGPAGGHTERIEPGALRPDRHSPAWGLIESPAKPGRKAKNHGSKTDGG